MKKLPVITVVALAAGIAVAAVIAANLASRPAVIPAPVDFDQRAAADDRIRALELAVQAERKARQLLEDELLILFDEIDALRSESSQVERTATPPADLPESRVAESMRQRRGDRLSEAARTEALIEAGFSPDRAEWILQREAELRVAAMQARFEAQRSGDMRAMFAAVNSSESLLRSELGDTAYERYLEAYNRSTTVDVGSVLESSPGQLAGLQRGDKIVNYDGQRVFSYTDLSNELIKGEAGEAVVVDILRDGAPMQIVLPRGPLGIESNRFRGR